ncbi:MAG TPA: hypothetical protein V6D08_18475 [Candidatus Obscuribacterales bacterium]
MKRSLVLGIASALLATSFAAITSAPADACDARTKAQARAWRQFQRQQLAQYPYSDPYLLGQSPYGYPVANPYANPYAYNQYPYGDPYGVSPYYPNGGGLLPAGTGSALLQSLIGLF